MQVNIFEVKLNSFLIKTFLRFVIWRFDRLTRKNSKNYSDRDSLIITHYVTIIDLLNKYYPIMFKKDFDKLWNNKSKSEELRQSIKRNQKLEL